MDDPVPPWVSRVGTYAGVLLFFVVWLLPTPDGLSSAGQRMAAVTALMGVFWVTQALPMEVTSLLPLALFPLLGIMSAKDVSASYFSDSSFLYLGGFVLALGIERWGLHRRFALRIVTATGTGVRTIVLGFMLATFGISMWISNTAATLLMLPIALALLTSLEQITANSTITPHDQSAVSKLGMALMLGIGYAATLGGMATLVGTPTNVVYLEVIQKQFPEAPQLSAGQWIATWTPCSLAFVMLTWGLLTFGLKRPAGLAQLDRRYFREQLQGLGAMQPGERWMLAIFTITALLWLTRTGFDAGDGWTIPGWNMLADRWLSWLEIPAGSRNWINDSTVAMLMALVMFVIPVRTQADRPTEPLMDWATASRLPWGILLLFGGGFAIADATRATGLAEWSGAWLAQSTQGWPTWLLIGVICLLVTFLSEFTSNVATANALLPIAAGLAIAMEVDPRLLMLPATLAASNGFMLPIGTPPNAIVFGTGRIRIGQMVGYGLLLDLLGVILIVVATYTLLVPQLGIGLSGLPDWVPANR
ncbi:SLC13/DASS family transporter [bacterium]|nr:SLC13/DASS family transporter [bacterium]